MGKGSMAYASGGGPDGLTLRTSELIVVAGASLALTTLLWHHARVDVWPAAGWFAFCIAYPLLARAALARFPGLRPLRFVVDMSLTAYIFIFYLSMNPVIDAVNMPLSDDWLARADQRLFGTQLSIAVQSHVPPWLNDVFLGAYTTHFFWPLFFGMVLWLQGRDDAFDKWATSLLVFLCLNYVFYSLVPAIGPRYFQAASFDGPVQGVYLAQHVEAWFRESPLTRDCFPSGHTGVALLVLSHMWRQLRWLFWIALPVLTCLIIGTVVGRFHYGIDLIAAVPLVLANEATARALQRKLPEGFNLVSRARLVEVATTVRRAIAYADTQK